MEFLRPSFYFKIDFFYSCINHGVRSDSLLENEQLLKGYLAEFKNVFLLDDLFFCYHKRHSII